MILRKLKLLVPAIVFALGPDFARAQEMTEEEACAACAGFGVVFFFIIAAIIVIHIALLVWVARDSKSRNMDSSVLWMLLVMATGIIGLLIYLFSRPQGNMVQCPHCGNKRLQASAKCPHCGNG